MFQGYATDKDNSDGNGHTYEETYVKLFEPRRESVTALLELGIYKGGSLRAFRDYFPNAQILGFDCDPTTMFLGEDRITTVLGNARSGPDLGTLWQYGPYDIVIDDASHRPIDQFQALKHLWPTVKPGGIYVVEDLELGGPDGSGILATCGLIVRGTATITLHLGSKRRDDLLILEKE